MKALPRLALLLVALVALAPLAALADGDECTKLCNQGDELLEAKEYEKALDVYKRARATDPKSCRAAVDVGLCLSMHLERWDEAIPVLEEAAKLESPPARRTAVALSALGNAYCFKSEWTKAVIALKGSVRLRRNDWSAWSNLSFALGKLERYEEAVEAGDVSLELKPDQDNFKKSLDVFRQQAKELALSRPRFEATFELPSLGGWAATEDMKALVVSVPTRSELLVFDTTTKDPPKRIAVDFEPGRLAVQGKLVYVAGRGAAKLCSYALDTLAVHRTFKLPGEPLVELACHRSRGLVYGIAKTGEVVAVDPSTGKVAATAARGSLLAVDPARAGFVYTATPSDASAEPKTSIRRHAVSGAELRLVEANDDIAFRAVGLAVSHDGKRLALAAHGRSSGERDDEKANVVLFFEAEHLGTAAGRFPTSSRPLAFGLHPLLDVGVVACERSVTQLETAGPSVWRKWGGSTPRGAQPGALVFAGLGKKVACWLPGDSAKGETGTLGFLSLELSTDDSASLDKDAGHGPSDDNEECKKFVQEGLDRYNRDDFAAALDAFGRARTADPKSSFAQVNYGACLLRLGRPDEAIPELEKVEKLEGTPGRDTARALYEIAACHDAKHDWEKAIPVLKAYVKMKASDPLGWRALASSLSNCKRHEEAIEAVETSLRLKPDQEDLKVFLDQLHQVVRERSVSSTRPTFDYEVALPPIGGWATTPDMKTLVVSLTKEAEVAIFDTTKDEAPRRVSLEFKPGRLVFAGKSIHAVAHGAGRIYSLDPETGAVQKTTKLPSGPLVDLAACRTRGLLYGLSPAGEVVSIDLSTGKVTTTQARGALLAVDPVKGAFVYVAGPADGKEGSPFALRKYAPAGGDLKLVETNENVAAKGTCIQLSPDGKRIAVTGEGGFGDPKDPAASKNAVLVLETDSIKQRAGRIEAGGPPVAIVFHPILDLALVAAGKSLLQLQTTKGFAESRRWPVELPPSSQPGSLAIAGGGTKVVCWVPGGIKNTDGTLGFVKLQLTADETAALEKAKPR